MNKKALQIFYILAIKLHMNLFALNMQHSGYVPGSEQWLRYLSCWKDRFTDLDAQPAGDFLSFETMIEIRRKKSDDNLRVDLSRSISDFHAEYHIMGGRYRDVDVNFGIGMLEPSDILPLKLFMPDLYEIRLEQTIDFEKSKYFKYGMDQDYSTVNSEYTKNALVIAQYGINASELMLMYPDCKTSDGESEIAIIGPAWEFRTPCFAEMMRQLSVYCLTEVDSMPPFSQQSVGNTCADCIDLDNIWWA